MFIYQGIAEVTGSIPVGSIIFQQAIARPLYSQNATSRGAISGRNPPPSPGYWDDAI